MDGPSAQLPELCITVSIDHAISSTKSAPCLSKDSASMLEDARYKSEDSDTLNTSFVERHNLTIRQGSSYLHRKATSHARWPHRLKEHLELLRCHYNFIRPHMALQFGAIRRTPAMQAGLTSKPLTFRQIFTSRVLVVFVIWARNQSVLTKHRKAA